MKVTIKNEYFKTSDLALTATLSLLTPFESIDRTNPHKAEFIFKRTPELEKLLKKFWSNSLKVEPLAFFNQLKIASDLQI